MTVGSAFRADPLALLSLTRPQEEWIQMGSPADPQADGRPCLWLGANQIGKSYAQAVKLLHFLRGTGPYRDRKPGPVGVCIVSISKEQIVPLMEKIWELLPKKSNERGEEHPIEAPDAGFEPGFGFRGKPPRIIFKSGPAAGSLVTFATYNQGSQRIAGATLDLLMLDEPPPESLWGEVVLRMIRRQGAIWITMTITPDAPPQEWLKEKVEQGAVRFMQTPLSVENMRPTDGLPPFLSQAHIQKAWNETPESDRPLRFLASWTGATVDRWLSAWSQRSVSDAPLPDGCQAIVALDHGIRPGRQAAILLAHHAKSGKFWVLDEIAGGDVATSTPDDARNILEMLRRNGISWEHIDFWIGDRAAASTRTDARKDNASLRRYLAAELGVNPDLFPRIEVPYKAAGTLNSGFRQINALLSQAKILVRPHCKNLINSFERWNGDKRSPLKDPLDALRYGIETILLKNGSSSPVTLQQRIR